MEEKNLGGDDHLLPDDVVESGNVFGRGVCSFVRSFPHTTAGI